MARIILLVLGCLPYITLAVPQAKVYQANAYEAQWETGGDRFACYMQHVVPYYGQALITREAGKPEIMELISVHFDTEPKDVKVQVITPPWHENFASNNVTTVSLDRGQKIIKLGESHSEIMVEALQRGYQPSFDFFHKEYLGKKYLDRSIRVSGVNFQNNFPTYQQCVTNLFPGTIKEMQDSEIYFEVDSEMLSKEGKQWLKDLADFINLYRDPDRITITGYADSRGTQEYNYKLSVNRAENVKYFLLEHGVDFDLIKTKYHGERYPIASNRDSKGRALNRRVDIKIKY